MCKPIRDAASTLRAAGTHVPSVPLNAFVRQTTCVPDSYMWTLVVAADSYEQASAGR